MHIKNLTEKLSMGKDIKFPDHRQHILWPYFQHVKDLFSDKISLSITQNEWTDNAL
mgnify:CR=1 FL=1